MTSVLSSSIWAIVLTASPVVKLVLILLLAISVFTWAIIFAKIRRFKQAHHDDQIFYELFEQSPNLSEVHTHAVTIPDSPMAGVFLDGYRELKRLKTQPMPACEMSLRIWLETLERGLKNGISRELAQMEATLPFLATAGNAAPFIGLFGTVWGIMASFHQIGLMGSASLATVAPGISEALIATAAGLFAAIPAVIAFNTFMSTLSGFETRLNGFANDFLNSVERQLVRGISEEQNPRIKTQVQTQEE